MADLAHLERKLHGYQVILWLKQTYEEAHGEDVDSLATQTESTPSSCLVEGSCCVSKSSVYDAYVAMCRREEKPTMFTRAVVGKMVRRAFPNVRTTRRGPRGRVTQHYVGLRAMVQAPGPEPACCPTTAVSPTATAVPTITTGGGDESACAYASPSQPELGQIAAHGPSANEEDTLDKIPGWSCSGEWPSMSDVVPPYQPIQPALQQSHFGQTSTGSSSSAVRNQSGYLIAPVLPSTFVAMAQQSLTPDVLHLSSPSEESKLLGLEGQWNWRLALQADEVWQPDVFSISAPGHLLAEDAMDDWES